ncbi:RNase P subunit p30-domain-containing protein [Apiosordaria backusii]|uniref:RNase P subunit p30-domain-containing protein n=1 Tax=Apiosordaria backusii TaxID=314023 RepID=A0AA40EYK8_9PEZI|nr:RNase P subunit p30-domain-containing protein [Apiosordaria backusii]
MLYDLNIAWSPGLSSSDLESTLRLSKTLGYDVVALNQTITGPRIPNQPAPITNPIPLLSPPHPSYPASSAITTTSTTSSSSLPPKSLPTILRRATLEITDPSTTNYRLSDFVRAYDLLALRPTSDKSFTWACNGTTDPPALISLDLTRPLGYHIHHRTAMAAVHRGSRFEICYSQAIRLSPSNPESARARSIFIGNVQSLLRATKGRGIVISSEAKSALGLRGPADVVNLMAVWGLGPEKGFEAMGAGARAVVVNEGVRRRGFRGVVDIVKVAEGGPEKPKPEEGEDTNGNGKQGKKQQKQKGGSNGQQQQQGQGQQSGQKRKNNDKAGRIGGGGGGGGGQQKPNKKMRKEGKA